MLRVNLEPGSQKRGVKSTKLILEAVLVGIDREAQRGLVSQWAGRFTGGRGVGPVTGGSVSILVHLRDSLGDLGPVTAPQHRCFSICDQGTSVRHTALPGWRRLMRQSLQSV